MREAKQSGVFGACGHGVRLAWALFAVLLMAVPAARAGDECEPGWVAETFCVPGVNGSVHASISWDDGTEEALYVGGYFEVAGCVNARNIARWDGQSWSALGAGLAGQAVATPRVTSLAVFDDGSGPALYVGGEFSAAGQTSASNIARWDGSEWSAVGAGVNDSVRSLTVFDDGSGPALYAGGDFTTAGGVPAHGIARWDGSTWSPLGAGVDDAVFAMAEYDDGSGSALYVGGSFISAGGVQVNRLARWDGESWSAITSGVNGEVRALCAFDDGSGLALFVGGTFSSAGGRPASNIARWDGVRWPVLDPGLGVNGSVRTLTVFDSGSGPALYAGGLFTSAGGVAVRGFARWNGSDWSRLPGTNGNGAGFVYSLAHFNDGSGPGLVIGGSFTMAGGTAASHVAAWKEGEYTAIGEGLTSDFWYNVPFVSSLTVADLGSGAAMYATGWFTVGGSTDDRIARWDGNEWSTVGLGPNLSAFALACFDGGNGPELFAGGGFTTVAGQSLNRIARFNGSTWSPVGLGMNGFVQALAVFDDGSGPGLYAGGTFTLGGGTPASRIARWSGTTWSALGSGVGGNSSASVRSLAVFDDGAGPALYAGGTFTTAGGQNANRIARWDGKAWSPLGSGVNGQVWAMVSYDDGSGPALYAGGEFTVAGEVEANAIAKWDGQTWTPLGSGTFGTVRALTVFDDGTGPALYAGGIFVLAGGVAAHRVARWDGNAWSALGAGTDDWVFALTVFDDGSGPALFAGGQFNSAGGTPSRLIAKWRGCPVPGCLPDLNDDDVLNLFDILIFVGWMSEQSMAADWNDDGVLDFFDVIAYVGEFDAGCP